MQKVLNKCTHDYGVGKKIIKKKKSSKKYKIQKTMISVFFTWESAKQIP